MHRILTLSIVVTGLMVSSVGFASLDLMKAHCSTCHSDEKLKGDFSLSHLGERPAEASIDLWMTCHEYLKTGEMPPKKESQLSDEDRQNLLGFLEEEIEFYFQTTSVLLRTGPRRLNNRELANSVSDVLMIEDVGTHQPTADLLGDTLRDGFDTHGDTLGLSQYHLEQYIEVFRKIVDATLFSGEQAPTRRYVVGPDKLRMTSLSQRRRAERASRTSKSIDFHDIRLKVYFSNFDSVPETGRYRIKIRATGKDRGVYDANATGIYENDPIRLRVHLGDRIRDFELPDDEVLEIELDEWLAVGSKLRLSYPTDGLRLRGNGNFKFQYAIAHDYLKENDPERYRRVLEEIVPRAPKRTAKSPRHWSHWIQDWEGPRPRLFGAEVEGPIYDSWPPRRQVALLGEDPMPENAEAILRPIAERAWRRAVRAGELAPIGNLVRSNTERLGVIGAFKEGIIAILVSPSFLLVNADDLDSSDRFATKLSYFLKSTTPDAKLRGMARDGRLQDFEQVLSEIRHQFDHANVAEFIREFPHAWLQLDRINFMAPDPDRYPLYDRKRLSDDMVVEVLRFFRHMVDHNLPITEFLSANYSFINADLAKIYQIDGVPPDSTLRKHTYDDGRRGGLLGMGAFLTLTADSLSTSPIHRAVYVMENFMGIHPAPPPPNVQIEEPDIRQAKTIKEVLAAHIENESCASCHKRIDPWGYSFENFDPIGAWRDSYTEQIARPPSRKQRLEIEKEDEQRRASGLSLLPRPWENEPIPVDASARFLNGVAYNDIVEYRKHLLTNENQHRFVRCFITKLLTYANGVEPRHHFEVEKIVSMSAANDYRIIDTIAAVIDSPLFREE